MEQLTLTAQARRTGVYDVVVCGGGPAGVAAGIAAARAGARVLLVEQTGCLGGAATNGMVSLWLGSYTRDHQHKVIAGILDEIVERALAPDARLRREALVQALLARLAGNQDVNERVFLLRERQCIIRDVVH